MGTNMVSQSTRWLHSSRGLCKLLHMSGVKPSQQVNLYVLLRSLNQPSLYTSQYSSLPPESSACTCCPLYSYMSLELLGTVHTAPGKRTGVLSGPHKAA